MRREQKTGLIALTRRLFRMAAPEKKLLTLSTLTSVLGNAGHMGLMGFGALALLRAAGRIAAGSVALWCACMLLSAGCIVLCRYAEGYASHAGAYRLLAKMRVHMFETLRRLAPACLMDRQKGDVLSVAVSDIETIEFFFAHTIGPLCTVILLPCITLAVAWACHPLYVLALLPVYLIVSLGLPLLAIRTGRNIGMRYRTQLGELKSLLLQSVYGLRDIQIYGNGPARMALCRDKTRQINRSAHQLTLHRQLVTAAPTFFIYLARILVAAVAATRFLSGADPAGVVVLSCIVSASFSTTQSLTTVITSLLETYAAAERIFAIEDTVPLVRQAPDAKPVGAIERIDFCDVSFGYRADVQQPLRHLDLTIRRGEHIGLMGESGSGKSTLIRLLLRFWDPDAGEIRVNGMPLTQLDLSQLYRRVAVLEQDTFLFNDTLFQNIALGKPDATQQEVEQAAEAAGLHAWICTLPQGYQTHMGEMGNRISGGERQRIGIARTLLMQPDVLILDEPTSNLDVLNEKALLKTLREAYADKTVLMVSHRASTLTDCTRVLRVQDGALTTLRDSDAARGGGENGVGSV